MNIPSRCLFIASQVFCLLVAILPPSALSQDGPSMFKQLAGPPEEILERRLKLPDPGQNGMRSKWAMLPVRLAESAGRSWQWRGDVPVDQSEDVSLMLFSPSGRSWDLSVQGARENPFSADDSGDRPALKGRKEWLGIDGARFPGRLYTFTKPRTGWWSARVKAAASSAKNGQPDGYLLVSNRKSAYGLFAHLNTYDLLVGRSVGLVAYFYDATRETRKVPPHPLVGIATHADMRVVFPDGHEMTVPMLDDGQHGDGTAGDGTFGGLIEAAEPGDYIAQAIVRGTTWQGSPLLRTSEHAFPILSPWLRLTGQTVATVDVPPRVRIGLEATLVEFGAGVGPKSQDIAETVQVFGEVWGKNRTGASIPVAWVGGMAVPESREGKLSLPVNLDARWIALAHAREPFELRNVRVQDVNTHIPLARLDVVPVSVPNPSELAEMDVTAIVPEMLEGPRVPTQPKALAYVGGRKHMLIHGYCARGPVW